MSTDIRYPNITETSDAGQLRQVKSFLFQLVEQLNWALKQTETGETAAAYRSVASGAAAETGQAVSSFNSIKGLIIKSADIVNAYYEKIDTMLKLSGDYVAQSDFGTYREETELRVSANSTSIEAAFADLQSIYESVAGLETSLIDVTAHVKAGIMEYGSDGAPVFGLEIGQRNVTEDGEEVFNQYARFTADRLSFYDSAGREVTYISDNKLFIDNAQVTGSMILGGYKDSVGSDGSIVTRWIGIGGA